MAARQANGHQAASMHRRIARIISNSAANNINGISEITKTIIWYNKQIMTINRQAARMKNVKTINWRER